MTSLYVDTNTLNVGIGTRVPTHSLHIQGNAKLTGGFVDTSNQPIWIPASTLEWKPTTSPPALTLPAGGAFTTTTATSLYRYFGRELSYTPTISGLVTSQPTVTSQDYLLSLPYPIDSNVYPSATIVGELWLNVQSGLSSNTFKSYARTIPNNLSNVTLRALTGTTDESLSTILATSRITLQGNLTYATPFINNLSPIPSTYIPATFSQDQVGKVALNTGGNPPRAQLDIITNSNTPALVVDQQGAGNIAEFIDAGVKKVVIDGNGNVGIGTSQPLEPFTVIGTPTKTASFRPLGGSISNVSTLSMYSTFGNYPVDTGPRYSARITSGFQDATTGIWGSEYLAFGVGNNGSPNDAQIDPLEKVRITCNGRLGIGTTNPVYSLHTWTGTIAGVNDTIPSFYAPSCAANSYNFVIGGANDVNQKLVVFINGSTRTADGGVNTTTIRNDGGNLVLGSTSYVTTTLTSSDYRRKKNIEPLSNVIQFLDNIQTIKYHYNDQQDTDLKYDGFFAHEIQEYIPTAVVNKKDEVDDSGNPIYQGIDTSKIIPFLTASIKDLKQLVISQSNQIVQLENRVFNLESS